MNAFWTRRAGSIRAREASVFALLPFPCMLFFAVFFVYFIDCFCVCCD